LTGLLIRTDVLLSSKAVCALQRVRMASIRLVPHVSRAMLPVRHAQVRLLKNAANATFVNGLVEVKIALASPVVESERSLRMWTTVCNANAKHVLHFVVQTGAPVMVVSSASGHVQLHGMVQAALKSVRAALGSTLLEAASSATMNALQMVDVEVLWPINAMIVPMSCAVGSVLRIVR
jgi:hypothetical protein